MGCLHKREVGIDKKRVIGVRSASERGVGGVVWTCVEDNVIEEKEDYKAIGLRGFYYKLF